VEAQERSLSSLCKITHDMTHSPEYRAWTSMKSRCYRESDASYGNYGGRGIQGCERWRDSFETFLTDIGMRPSAEYSLDRYPNIDGDYESGNCRWATRREQSQNRRSSVLIEFHGETRCIVEWERLLGFPRGGIQRRLYRGWSAEKALATPRNPKHRST
jgi:hypothetical protein